MTAFAPMAGLHVRAADLRDRGERDRIDAFVMEHPDAELFHRPAWSLAVERGCGQCAHYLVADSRGGLQAVLPLTELRSPLFGSTLVSTGFGVGGGILGGGAGAEALAEAAWALAGRLGCSTIEVRGGELPPAWQRREGLYAGFVRNLPQGDEAILSSIPRKQRAEVRRAGTFTLNVKIGRAAADLTDHYAVYCESVRNLGTPVFPQSLFAAMLDGFGDADILTVSKDGRPVAAVLSFYFNGRVMPYWGGGTAGARTFRANELMYFELMRHASRRGCTRFDFGRSKIGTGPYAFKKNWGFAPVPLVYAARTADGAPPREINPLSPKYRLQAQLWKRLPLWLANRLGPPIARGLG